MNNSSGDKAVVMGVLLWAGVLTSSVMAQVGPTDEASTTDDVSAVETSDESSADTESEMSDDGAGADAACENGVWNLAGAATEHKTGNVSYRDEWTPDLEQAARCVSQLHGTEYCVLVQGQYDNVPFPPRIAATFGGQRAAQLARATARSAMVADKLKRLGVPNDHVQMMAPPAESQFRGASVTIDLNCRPSADGQTVVLMVGDTQQKENLTSEQVGAVVEKKLVEENERVKEERRRKLAHHQLMADVGFVWTPSVIAPDLEAETAFHYLFVGSFGWHGRYAYARVGGGGGPGHPESYRGAAMGQGAIGYYGNPLLQLGVQGGFQMMYPGETTWLARSWFVGVEAHQCILGKQIGFGELCFREAVSPLGQATTRLELDGSALVRVNEKIDYTLRFAVGVLFRFNLLNKEVIK